MKRLEIVHNIPTPYRTHLFSALAEEGRARSWDVFVNFMAKTEPDRTHWLQSLHEARFPYCVWADYGPTLRRKVWHFNPGLIARVAYRPPSAILIGGPWDSLTGGLASLSARSPIRIGWAELNLHSPGRSYAPLVAMKRRLLSAFTHFAAPGSEGKLVLEHLAGPHKRPVIFLPNIVDERKFNPPTPGTQEKAIARTKFGLRLDGRLALWPARLIEAKNVVSVMSALRPEILGGWQIAIFGTGPDEASIRAIIAERRLEPHIKLCGVVSYAEMPQLYNAADLFLLPSRHDPNPLSVVEAMFSGLPILVSKQIGNFPEALVEGVNGWGCDGYRTECVMEALQRALSTSHERLAVMGNAGKAIARSFWGTQTAVKKFFDGFS